MRKNLLFVLLADDDDDDRLFFKKAFEEVKIQTKVEFVRDSEELMKYLTNRNAILPDILFLNLHMSKKTGHECLVEIKKNNKLKNFVIAVYSTASSEEDIEDIFIKGANIYIKKPNNFKSLKKIIDDLMALNWQYRTVSLNRDNFLLRLT
jgi:CheY-like chemotaxis protein